MAAIYQATIYCNDCADLIRKDLKHSGTVSRLKSEGADLNDERTYDSDDYPKYCVDHAEADSPQHCDHCGLFLENDLTDIGYEYVKNAIETALYNGNFDSTACTEWADFYGITVRCVVTGKFSDYAKVDELLKNSGSCVVEYEVD